MLHITTYDYWPLIANHVCRLYHNQYNFCLSTFCDESQTTFQFIRYQNIRNWFYSILKCGKYIHVIRQKCWNESFSFAYETYYHHEITKGINRNFCRSVCARVSWLYCEIENRLMQNVSRLNVSSILQVKTYEVDTYKTSGGYFHSQMNRKPIQNEEKINTLAIHWNETFPYIVFFFIFIEFVRFLTSLLDCSSNVPTMI